MKKFLFGLVLFLFPAFLVNANSISNIDMDIYVDKAGDAYVTEVWKSKVSSGTEGYHPYYNLGDAKISDVSVKMDGKEYTTISNWDIHSSLSEKAYKAGLYYPDSSEVDICFGLSNYGRHTYEIKYKISGFVVKTEDADMIYWTLMPHNFSVEPDRVHIKIYSDEPYSDTLDVWGYGQYGAYTYVYDGYIEMETRSKLESDEYMTILVKFPLGTFNTKHTVEDDFNYYFDMAEEGAISYEERNNSITFYIILILCSFFIPIGFVLLVLFIALGSDVPKYQFGSRGGKIPKDVPFYRDIPCNKDIFRSYFIATRYSLNKKKEDFLGAILLKWLKQGNIKVERQEVKKLFKTETQTDFILVNPPIGGNKEEVTLYNWIREASEDGILEKGEFQKWCSNHYSSILNWFDKVLDKERDVLIQEGNIAVGEQVKFKFFKNRVYRLSDNLMDEAIQMAGLKRFLKEFTLIKQREPIEVALWNEYLMYAQIFGIADEVAKQFKKLYPEVIMEMNGYGYDLDTVIFLNYISSRGIASASSAKSRAESYSSGGGGFSSGGGGGGSFGGGGGGGGFR